MERLFWKAFWTWGLFDIHRALGDKALEFLVGSSLRLPSPPFFAFWSTEKQGI